jgi:hypothetical protein
MQGGEGEEKREKRGWNELEIKEFLRVNFMHSLCTKSY